MKVTFLEIHCLASVETGENHRKILFTNTVYRFLPHLLLMVYGIVAKLSVIIKGPMLRYWYFADCFSCSLRLILPHLKSTSRMIQKICQRRIFINNWKCNWVNKLYWMMVSRGSAPPHGKPSLSELLTPSPPAMIHLSTLDGIINIGTMKRFNMEKR